MTLFEKILLSLAVAVGSVPLGFGLYCVGACVWEQATSESTYPYSGFCPDSPNCWADVSVNDSYQFYSTDSYDAN